jgi:hypothetical protein
MYGDDNGDNGDNDNTAVIESIDSSEDNTDDKKEEGGPKSHNPLSSLLYQYAEVDDKDNNEDNNNKDNDIILSQWLKTPALHPWPPPASISSLPKGKGRVKVLVTTQTNRELLTTLECIEMGLSCPVYVPLCLPLSMFECYSHFLFRCSDIFVDAHILPCGHSLEHFTLPHTFS